MTTVVLVLTNSTGGLLGCVGSHRILVSSSTEKDGLIRQLADRYNGRRHTVQGRCAQVGVTGLTSGAAMSALAQGWPETLPREPNRPLGPPPQVWLPSSGMWLDLLRRRWRRLILGRSPARSSTEKAEGQGR